MATVPTELARRCVDTIKMLSVDAVEKAKSGHPGAPMGCADMAFVLWTKFLRFDPKDPGWINRDRFVLSNGHASMLLYSMLHLHGYDLPMSELQRFRQLGSKTPGHPEYGHAPGVETTTGPLGQGFANAVGMALGQKMMQARFPDLLDHHVYGILGDGCVMEGVTTEAASLAGHLGLGNLVFLYDDNTITIEGHTDLAFSEKVTAKFEALGWHVQAIDGHDHAAVEAALQAARAETARPSLIAARTIIGKGSPNKANTAGVHGEPLGADELGKTKDALGWPREPTFLVPPEVQAVFDGRVQENRRHADEWRARHQAWRASDPARAALLDRHLTLAVPDDLEAKLLAAVGTDAAATRVLASKVLQAAAAEIPAMVGGAADLDPSTKTAIKDGGSVGRGAFGGRTLHFGIREHAMGSVSNGLALYGGLLPHTATFMVFADYMRPPMRLACLMKTRTTFVFTHDSIFLGEDGPTHQPVEQLSGLRQIPGMSVWRPADGVEVAMAWAWCLGKAKAPTSLILTRQNVPNLERPASFTPRDVWKGAYVVVAADRPDVVLVASGSEVGVAVAAAKLLAGKGVRARVLSVPCRELFEAQPRAVQSALLPAETPVCVLEAARLRDWCALVGKDALLLGQESFGASAPAKDLAAHFGFTPEAVADKVVARLA